MWVVKLGGSLANSYDLAAWLAVLGEHGLGRAVIVPGGGPFADQVRASQERWRFGDWHANRMALAAMDQYGILMTAIHRGLVSVTTEHELDERLVQQRVPVWLPSRMLADCEAIPPTWDISADSLAAWLAHRLRAKHLLLIKSATPPTTKRVSVVEICQRGIVDRQFHRFLRPGFSTWWLHAAEHPLLSGILNKTALPHTLVLP